MKTFVLDTNILLHDPNSVFSFGANEIVIPAIVLEELDSKKREQNEIGRNARYITRVIKELRKNNEGKLSTGLPLENGGILRIELNHISFNQVKDVFSEETNDNRIIAVVLNLKTEFENGLNNNLQIEINQLKKQFEDYKITYEEYWEQYYEKTGRLFTLISNDNLVVAKADTLGLKIEQYESDRVENLDSMHKGFHEVYVPSEIINKFYQFDGISLDEIDEYIRESIGITNNEEIEEHIYTQDFIILKDLHGSRQSGLGRVIRKGNSANLVTLIMEEEEKDASSYSGIWGIKSKNVQQKMLLELLLDPNVNLVVGLGAAGTGKTLLALAAGLQQVEIDRDYKKILAARPVIPMGKDIGYLPGEKEDKLRPWMQPIYDNLEFLLGLSDDEQNDKDHSDKRKKTVDEEIQNLKIEVEALTYIRGRSIPKQFLIIDEAQNLTGFEAKTLISRAGEGTKIILLGDPEQIDHPYLDATNNALTYVAERMKKEDDVGIIKLEKTERSVLAEKAAKLL